VLLTATATLFQQLEKPFPAALVPLASAGERDFIYSKSDIVYISTSAILSMRKRHNLLLHQFQLQKEQHILQQQLELPITERAKCTFNSKSIAIYSSS
jgi:hypothetical protein